MYRVRFTQYRILSSTGYRQKKFFDFSIHYNSSELIFLFYTVCAVHINELEVTAWRHYVWEKTVQYAHTRALTLTLRLSWF